MQTILLLLAFASTTGLVLGMGLWLTRDDALNRRLNRLGDTTDTPDKSTPAAEAWRTRIAKVAGSVAWLSMPKEGWQSSNFRIRFMRAGLRGAAWPAIFFGTKTVLTLALPGLLVLLARIGNWSVTPTTVLASVLLLATLGYYLPNLVLAELTRRRRRELQEALPDAADVMRVCVEAGLGLDAAIQRSGEEMDVRSHALAEELKLVMLDLRVGSSRESSLQNLVLRTDVDDIATFVTVLLQSERFGTNVADSFRVLSDTMREQRKTRAEERAAKIPLKLLFPLIFLIFPALFVVLMGPAFISIYRVLLPTMTGGR